MHHSQVGVEDMDQTNEQRAFANSRDMNHTQNQKKTKHMQYQSGPRGLT